MKILTISKFFNKNSHHSKLIFIIVAIGILILFFIGGIIVNLPVLILISVYALVISNAALLFNKRVLNSLAIPFTINYFCVMIYDFSQMNLLFAFFHIVTVIPCLIIIFRTKISLILMLIASICYAFWILSIEVILDFPYYKCIFNICDVNYHFLIVLVVGLCTSLIASNHKLKIFVLNYLKIRLNLFKEE